MSRNRVYVARKECGCIVAAFPVGIDKAVKGELMKQLAKAGLDIEQASELDVQMDFHLTCNHNRPPLLAYMDERTKEGRDNLQELGIDQADVNAAGSDLTPEAEEAEAQIAAEEDAQEQKVDHQAEADDLLSNFLEKKDDDEGEEDAEEDDEE